MSKSGRHKPLKSLQKRNVDFTSEDDNSSNNFLYEDDTYTEDEVSHTDMLSKISDNSVSPVAAKGGRSRAGRGHGHSNNRPRKSELSVPTETDNDDSSAYNDRPNPRIKIFKPRSKDRSFIDDRLGHGLREAGQIINSENLEKSAARNKRSGNPKKQREKDRFREKSTHSRLEKSARHPTHTKTKSRHTASRRNIEDDIYKQTYDRAKEKLEEVFNRLKQKEKQLSEEKRVNGKSRRLIEELQESAENNDTSEKVRELRRKMNDKDAKFEEQDLELQGLRNTKL
jgi:hypothetical protein